MSKNLKPLSYQNMPEYPPALLGGDEPSHYIIVRGEWPPLSPGDCVAISRSPFDMLRTNG